MAKTTAGWIPHSKRVLLLFLLVVSVSTALVFLLRTNSDPCDSLRNGQPVTVDRTQILRQSDARVGARKNPLGFMKSKLVLLVSHELSLSGGPLLLMELAFLLRNVGSRVVWITYPKYEEKNEVTYSLEHKMLTRGVQVFSARGQEAIDTAIKADLVILNTAVAGKWLDGILKEQIPQVVPKILWWIHEMRGHYFKLEYVKHLPFVAGAMIDSQTTTEYWKTRTHDRLKINMPETYVVHLGNSKDLMEIAEDNVAKRVLREHIRESLGVRSEDLIFAIINSKVSFLISFYRKSILLILAGLNSIIFQLFFVYRTCYSHLAIYVVAIVIIDSCELEMGVSRGKGQDLFLRSFYESLLIIREKKLRVPSMHAVIVGSDMNVQTKFETELREFVQSKDIEGRVHFVNKTLTVAPYLAAIDVLVQNSQARGECFGRITIEAMAFKLPVLGTAAGGTTEIVVNGSTGLLHPVGKEGVIPLATNMVKLATHVERRLTMGRKGYERVRERFMEHHMAERIASVLIQVIKKSKGRSRT
ncbi:hypothetical protein ZIOFF_015197 [Zingiber officinale]|uniref:Glycosyl transferase family 1 domain-containing protein n=1 Tax=Zingiber officinale TaxID=94328 RepID=A0A8J5HY90_ZINOF|nr:hypothetical protein ZIOFF_015197 [Zingiber officinale]